MAKLPPARAVRFSTCALTAAFRLTAGDLGGIRSLGSAVIDRKIGEIQFVTEDLQRLRANFEWDSSSIEMLVIVPCCKQRTGQNSKIPCPYTGLLVRLNRAPLMAGRIQPDRIVGNQEQGPVSAVFQELSGS